MPGGTLTPELFADDYCEAARQGLIEVIRETVIPPGEPQPGEKVAEVFDRLIVDSDGDQWAAALTSPRHVEQPPLEAGPDAQPVEKVHAVMVDAGGIETYEEPSTNQAGFRLRFVLDAYYEDEIGTNADNPAKWQAREIAMLAWAILSSRTLNRPGIVLQVYAFRERRGLRRMGERKVRQSLGEVWVDLQPVTLKRTPAP
jgi:hypothetical protein